jgi:hypothetical protein
LTILNPAKQLAEPLDDMTNKNWIRAAVLTGLLAWPGLETYRLWVAKKQLTASAELERSVSQRLVSLKKLHVPSLAPSEPEILPVKSPAATAPAPSSSN